MLNTLAFIGLGLPELAVIGLIILLLFGNRLPGLMRSLGRSVIEFKKGVHSVEHNGQVGSNDQPGSKGTS